MKQPPSNRNVPQHIWDRACLEYRLYLSKYKTLMDMGLSDEAADQYLDAYDVVDRVLRSIDPNEPDFPYSDHRSRLTEADAALKILASLLS